MANKKQLKIKGGVVEEKKHDFLIIFVGFFALLGLLGAALFLNSGANPDQSTNNNLTPPPQASIAQKITGAFNNSQVIRFRDQKLLFSDEHGVTRDFFLDSGVTITKGAPPPKSASTSELNPGTRVNLYVQNDLITKIYIIE